MFSVYLWNLFSEFFLIFFKPSFSIMKHKSRFQLFSRITIFEISRRNRELANFVDERKSIPTLSSCLRSFFFPLFKGRNEKIVEKESEEGTREDSIDALIKPVLPRKSRNIRIAARFYLARQEKVRFVVDARVSSLPSILHLRHCLSIFKKNFHPICRSHGLPPFLDLEISCRTKGNEKKAIKWIFSCTGKE